MIIGVLCCGNEIPDNYCKLKKLLYYSGFELAAFAGSGNIADDLDFLIKVKSSAAIIVTGDSAAFYEYINATYGTDTDEPVFVVDGCCYGVMPQFDKDFITASFIPALNSKSKTFYSSSVFKTYGKGADELKKRLKDVSKNRSRVQLAFFPEGQECEVVVRYTNKMQRENIDTVLRIVTEQLRDCSYAYSDVGLAEQAAILLKIRGKRLKVAESFTGGAIAAEIVRVPGASNFFTEGIVSYSNLSKMSRLGVEPRIIKQTGAVSIETAYEMAAGLLTDQDCDIALATTGNAGPTAEKPGTEGVCFIAVGDKSGIHIFEYRFEGDRRTVIESGVKAALYRLCEKLHENEFEQLIKRYEAAGGRGHVDGIASEEE